MIFFETAQKVVATRIIVAMRITTISQSLAALVSMALMVVSIEARSLAQLPDGNCGEEIWEISTRHLPCSACCVSTPISFEVNRWTNCRWERGSIEAATGPAGAGNVPLTIIYVHGNWMERENARERARIVNCHIARAACGVPYRLLMFSWPSQRDNRIIRDVRDNAQCADSEAYYLASLLRLVTATSERVSLLGFSFGARTVTGALHLDAGGSLAGNPMLPMGSEHAPYRVSLVAPAVDRDWLQVNGRNRNAMNHVDALVNLYNSKDPILRRFRFIDSIARPIAAGFAGFEAVSNPRSTEPLMASDRIQQFDCGMQIGSTHSEVDYYGKCPHFKKAIDNLLWKTP